MQHEEGTGRHSARQMKHACAVVERTKCRGPSSTTVGTLATQRGYNARSQTLRLRIRTTANHWGERGRGGFGSEGAGRPVAALLVHVECT